MMFLRKLALSLSPTLLALPFALPASAQPAQAAARQPAVIEADLEANFDFRCALRRSELAGKSGNVAASLLLGSPSGASQIALTFAGDALRLTRKVNGKAQVLAAVEHLGLPSGQGAVPLVVQWRAGSLRVIYGGRTVLRREGLGTLPQGATLSSSGGAYEFSEPQCQPVEPVAFADDFMRVAGEAGQWEPLSGEWKIRSASDPAKVANAFTYAGAGKSAISITGRWFWDDYRVGAAVRPEGQSEVGLIAYWQDAKNYILFRWLPEEAAGARGREKQLWRVWHGQPSLLASAPGGYRAKEWYHLSVCAVDGVLSVDIDGQQVLQKRTDLFGQGKIGLYASGDAPLLVDDVTVEHASSHSKEAVVRRETITPQFTREESMENWASPKAEWLPDKAGPEATFWNRGAYFGDHAVEIKAKALELNRAKIVATLCADGKSPESGYSLVVTQGGDKDQAQATLLRRGKAVSPPRAVKLGATGECAIRLEQVGKTVRAWVAQVLVASFADAQPLAGRRAGYSAVGAQVAPVDADVSGGNLYDYTFYRAPTDWYVSGGTWDMTSRWDCTPTWSWYGGWSERIAAIWNKHSFEGDMTVDFFAACKREGGSYQHPRDINITIAGDGRDLASGYSLIFGGWNNTATRLMRGTQVVAESTKYLLPRDYQGQAHHKWFNLRVEKVGATISFYVDHELALQYTDPKPLTGRRVALWTCGNGVMIARATLFYQRELAPEPTPLLIQNHDWAPVPAEKLGWISRQSDASLRLEAVQSAPTQAPAVAPAVRALNLDGGGAFAISPQLEPFDALKTPRLSFDCRFEKGAAVNLYLRARGVTHSVRLSGPSKEMEMEHTQVLAVAPDARDDGQWHHVDLDLAALLKPLYPNEAEIRVEEIFLGSATQDSYRQAGFGANFPGASYLVRGFALRSSDNRVAQAVGPELKPSSPRVAVSLAAPSLIAAIEKPEAAPAPGARARGLRDVRVTYCQDADAGEFKADKLNQPIGWACFSRPLVTDKVSTIDFDWADKPPHEGVSAKYWSARFFGKLLVPQAGDYVFAVDRLDDGARLFIDGKPVIESWKIQAAASQASQPITLTPGAHAIRLDYSQGTGLGSLTLRWSGPGFEREVIPQAARRAAPTQTAMAAATR